MLASASVLGRVELGSFGALCGNWYVHSELHCSVCMSMRQWCLLVKRRSRGLRLRRTHSLHWIVRVCSRLVHEVVEVTKLLGSLYLCGWFLRERCDACNLQHHGTEPFLAICVGNCILKCNATAIQLLSMVRATPRLRPHNDAVVWTSVAQWQSMVLNSNFLFWNQACHGIVLKSSMSWHRDLLQTFADIVKYSSWARMWTNGQDAFRSVWTWRLALNIRNKY